MPPPFSYSLILMLTATYRGAALQKTPSRLAERAANRILTTSARMIGGATLNIKAAGEAVCA